MSSVTLAAYDRHVRVDRAMVYSVIAAGIAAGLLIAPGFLFATPPIALWLMWRSQRAAPAKSELAVDDTPNQMPTHVELAVHDAVAQLPAGDARRLLGDIVRQARPLFASLGSHFDAASDEEVRTQTADLVVAACDTALELARIDGLLASETRGDLRARLTETRADFATRLANAATALGSMYASGVEHGTAAANVVAELAKELTADASARVKARAEMEQLLG